MNHSPWSIKGYMLCPATKKNQIPTAKSLAIGLKTVAVVTLCLAIAQPAQAAAVRSGLFTGNTLTRNDDGSTGLVNIGFNTNFYGTNYSQLFVNNNGNVTFNGSLSTFTPFGITTAPVPIIAPFFADVDTRNSASGVVTYGIDTVNGRSAFGVNWLNVGYYSGRADKLNSFQLVFVDRSDIAPGDFDIEFNYDGIQWETGEASGGTGGLGGASARVGFSNGDTVNPPIFFELPGSGVNGAFLDGGSNSLVANRLNSDVDGRYLFSVRSGSVIPAEPIPTPALLPGLVGLGVGILRKRKNAAIAEAKG